MVKLRLGKINNEERKFIPTKMNFLEEYLKNITKIEEYELLQMYDNGYKYRRYNDNGVMKYTRNYKMDKITDVVEISKDEFNKKIESSKKRIRKIRKYYIDGEYEIDVDYFIEPISMIMIEVSSNTAPLKEYQVPRGFIDVTNNKMYENSSIYNGSIAIRKAIIEGTDAVGKSTIVEKLLEEGIICKDRCMDVFSKYMLFTIPMDVRVKKYQEYLKQHNEKVIFLINNDKEELEKRISKRTNISEFDLDAYKYNKLYLETYKYMELHNMLENKLFLVDCTNLTIDEELEKVKKIIEMDSV